MPDCGAGLSLFFLSAAVPLYSLAQSKARWTARRQPWTFSSRWAGEMEGVKVRSTAQLRRMSSVPDQ